jgi:hypothetical protein
MTRLDTLKREWCKWNGQTGTEKQRARIRATETDLERMLGERGVHVSGTFPHVVTRTAWMGQ